MSEMIKKNLIPLLSLVGWVNFSLRIWGKKKINPETYIKNALCIVEHQIILQLILHKYIVAKNNNIRYSISLYLLLRTCCNYISTNLKKEEFTLKH